MALPNAFAQYSNNKVMTASPAELTLMLYEGAIKFCNIAMIAMEQKNVQKAHTNIIKTQKIVEYLRQTLDMKYPVAKDFENIYVYLEKRLVQANVKKDSRILEECLVNLREVRDTWKNVMRMNREKGNV